MSAAPDAVASAAAAPAGTAPSSAALANDGLALTDWRRRVFEPYRDVREARECLARQFAHVPARPLHPQDPLGPGDSRT